MMYAHGMRGFGRSFMGVNPESTYHYFNIGGMMMMILMIVLTGFLIYTLYKNNQKKEVPTTSLESTKPEQSQALEILKLKLVNGEIGEEEYARKKELIQM